MPIILEPPNGIAPQLIRLSEQEVKELNWSGKVLLRHKVIDGKLVIEVAPIPVYSLD